MKQSRRQLLLRLRFGKCLLNDVLKMMGKHPDGMCDFCVASNVKEEENVDVKHYLMDLWSICI